jgi:hypothetical protein
MWELIEPNPVKLIIGILAADQNCLDTANKAISAKFGLIDHTSDVWPFTQTDYYKDETGPNILRQFVSLEKLIDPGKLAKIKHAANKLEQKLAQKLKVFNITNVIASKAKQSQSLDTERLLRRPDESWTPRNDKKRRFVDTKGDSIEASKLPLPRPVNLDPGFIEPSKLVLATTKNYSHRIYIGHKMFAEVTLIYEKNDWRHFDYTYPDYRQTCYHDFFTKVRTRLLEQLKSCH